jgi:hypothetical protein
MVTLRLRITCIAAPFQVEGTFCGIDFYYRARHGKWTMTTIQGETIGGISGIGEYHNLEYVVELLRTSEPWATAYNEWI